MWEVDIFSVIGGFFLFIDERMKKKIPGMYVIAVLMPYINSSFPRSANLEGSGNFATSCEGEPQSPPPSTVSSPSKELGTSSDRTDGEQIPGVRLDVTSLPEDTDPQPASSEYSSSGQTLQQKCSPGLQLPQQQRAARSGAHRRLTSPAIGSCQMALRPGGLQGRSRPALLLPPACLGRAKTGEG